MIHTRSRHFDRGFSLLELAIVLAVSLIVAATAIPQIMTAVYNARLRSGASTLSGLLQDGRMQSVKRNTMLGVHFATSGTGALAYVDLDADTTPDGNEPQVQLGTGVTKSVSPPVLLTNSTLGFTPETNLNLDPWFSSRGLPCKVDGGVTTCTGVGFALYFTDNRAVGSGGWAAVTITPAGRIKTWFYNGSAWAD